LQQAVDWDIIPKNPMVKVKKPKVPKRRPKVVDSGGFARLVNQSRGLAIFPVIVLGMATGMRRGELLALEWTDLDWDKATIEVSKSLEETKAGLRIKGTKSGETRRFTIPADVLEILRAHHLEQLRQQELYGADYAGRNLVFARPDGEFYGPDKMGTRIRHAMEKAGLSGVSLHSLRHSHASELLSKGVPITAVSERLGHASPNVTLSIYSHAMPKDDRLAAEVWSKAMGDALKIQPQSGGLSLVITRGAKKTTTPEESVG
jgi:integrase